MEIITLSDNTKKVKKIIIHHVKITHIWKEKKY